MRTLEDLAAKGDKQARLAIEIFCYRVRKYIGAYMAALGSLDAVIFTGGIGENAAEVRAAACADMPNLGIVIDPEKNTGMVGRKEGAISTPDSATAVLVIPTDEEAAIADDTYQTVKESTCPTK